MQLQWRACSYSGVHAVTVACMQLQWRACSYSGVHAIYKITRLIFDFNYVTVWQCLN